MSNRKLRIPDVLYREISFERAAIKEEDRTLELSFSSEYPVERWYGTEILDHGKGSVEMERMESGTAPLLFNHRADMQIGVCMEAKLDGKTLRAKVKFSRSQLGEEKFQDVRDGILKTVSIGYRVKDMVLESEKGDHCTYRVTRWEPYELTMTPIPADPTVGVGRNGEDSQTREILIPEKESVATGPEKAEKRAMNLGSQTRKPLLDKADEGSGGGSGVDVVAERKGATDVERKRVKDILDLAQHFRDKGLAGRKIETGTLAADCMHDGSTVEEFQNKVVRGNFPEVKPNETAVGEIGMSNKEKKQFSLTRCIVRLANKLPIDGLEKEASEAHAKLLGRDLDSALSFYIPQDVWRGPAFPNHTKNEQLRALFAGIYQGAGALIGTDFLASSLIELLRNEMFVVELGARTLSGLKGNVQIPRQTGAATATWQAEDSTHTRSQQAVGQLNLVPHKLMASTAYTLQLLNQGGIDVEAFVRQDLMSVIALERDRAAINGSGVSGEPRGILAYPTSGTDALSTPVTLASAESLTYAKALEFETNVSLNNAARGKLAYLTSIRSRSNAKTLAEIQSTNSNPVWKNNMVNGYPARATNQMPTATGVLFGNWDDLILADWADTSILVDPYSLSLQSQISVVMQLYCDQGLRHTASFAKGV